MEFQFGTNWAPFSEAVGNFFGSVIGFEASWAFMLGISGHHVVWLGARQPNHSLSLYILSCDWGKLIHALDLTANSWMQTLRVEMVEGKFVVHDYFQAIANPSMAKAFSICSWQHWKLRYL